MNYARLLGTGMFCRTEGGCVATLTLARPTRITLVSNCGKLLLRFAIHLAEHVTNVIDLGVVQLDPLLSVHSN